MRGKWLGIFSNVNIMAPNAEEVQLFGREKDQRSCTISNAAILSGGRLTGGFIMFTLPVVFYGTARGISH